MINSFILLWGPTFYWGGGLGPLVGYVPGWRSLSMKFSIESIVRRVIRGWEWWLMRDMSVYFNFQNFPYNRYYSRPISLSYPIKVTYLSTRTYIIRVLCFCLQYITVPVRCIHCTKIASHLKLALTSIANVLILSAKLYCFMKTGTHFTRAYIATVLILKVLISIVHS